MSGDDSGGNRTLAKIKKDPLMAMGLVGWAGVVAYGLYGIKNRQHSLAVHLIHTRVIAQAVVVGAVSGGVAYKIYSEHFRPWMWPVENSSDK